MISEVFNCDCLDYMRTLPDKFFDLCIADPPYRDEDENAPQKEMRSIGMDNFGNKPTKHFFEEMERVSKAQIVWGANNFGYPFKGFVAWDKMVRGADRYSQVEIASLSENLGTVSRYVQISCYFKGKIHPTSKPVELYGWLLRTYLNGGGKIFDPFLGSQSSRIAAYKLGFDFWGCEINKDFFDKGNERFQRECHGEFKVNGQIIKQGTLFD